MKNNTKYMLSVLLFVCCFHLFNGQIGDNGYPFLYRKLLERGYNTRDLYKDSNGNYFPFISLKDNIPFFETNDITNQKIIEEVSRLKDEIYLNQNIYGKSVYKEINIANNNNRIEYDGRYYYLYKIKSSDAKALQIYFKKYHLSAEAKLFFYSENGFIIGEFNDKNNPEQEAKGLDFGTQPIPGNTFYIELSYPISAVVKPELIAEKIIHSTTDFYSGAYGEAGNCHKNVACDFTGTNDKSRNIKSVGLMLYPIYKYGVKQSTYSATCSGNLMNNTKQDGTPYFLTAGHCIGYTAANNNINWSTELITLFNYEAKSCSSNGSDAPSSLSNNSTLGCTVLAQSPEQSLDYALLKLNGTTVGLAQYKICYAGWDNNSSAYSVNMTNSYGVHHPKGDVKKISLVQEVYPVMSNQPILQSGLFGYYGVPWPLNSQGTFLQNSWRNGIVEKGSSGSPLFNSFDRLIGSLSTGSDPNIFNCGNTDIYNSTGNKLYTYYSRFSNNYYTMSAWLNPLGTSVQSIGAYCPNTSLQIGAPINVIIGPDPGPINPTIPTEVSAIDVNGKITHPANTFGKNIYLKNSNTSFDNENEPNTNFEFFEQSMYISDNLFAASTNLYMTGSQKVIDKFEVWGIYKIVDCNKLKYIKPARIIVRNPVTISGVLNLARVDIVGVTDNLVHILIDYRKRDANNNLYRSYELQTYKVINNELVYVTNYPIATNIVTEFGVYNQLPTYVKNRVMIVKNPSNYNSARTANSYFFNELTNTWFGSNAAITFTGFPVIYEDKVFVSSGNNSMDIYTFISNSPNLTFHTTLPISGGWFFSKRSDNVYWMVSSIGTPISSQFKLVSLDLSNNTVTDIPVSDSFKNSNYGGNYTFIIRDNDIVKILKPSFNPPPGSEYLTHVYTTYTNTSGTWEKNKENYVKWKNIAGFNKKYLVSIDQSSKNSPDGGVNWTLNLKEIDFITHPYAIYDNATLFTSAYHRPKKIDHYSFEAYVENGKRVFNNILYSNLNNFPFGYRDDWREPYNGRTKDEKTVILDGRVEPVTGNKNVYIYAKYSVDMKPGFSISSATGTEFHAIAQAPLPADVPACSFMFDDMLNPQLTETPNETIYLKQAGGKSGNQPHYGEIVLNDGIANKEVVIDRGVKLYPNPTKDILTIDFNGNVFKTLEVYSIDAKKILTQEVSSKNSAEVNLSQYPAGIYMVTLIDSNGKTYPNKVIKK
ncbi:T9SS C-terminal target domain-containing protein [Chryseobacterium indologenes]|uniref:T9SS type A sorting domain-containing protein n=1 Tax=Chryseobacterium indologenes TaxID=253 RepID=UPI000B51E103|nr:T9SS type A sorting domain-containing protein [Chryseobacterium indologenes]ASE63867.1 T9SS C-terminal target domain-containing protein [Chryseobacterium indologenes]